MLLTLAIAGSLFNHGMNAAQLVKRGDHTYDSQPMYQHTEQVPDPRDPSKTVTAQVSYFVQFKIHIEDEPDDRVVTRVVRTRPEQPARTFEMSQQRVDIEDNADNYESMRALSQTLDTEHIPISNAGILNRALQAMRERSIEDVDPKPITIDPNEGIAPGGWTVREYGYDLWYTDLHMQIYKSVLLPQTMGPVVTPIGSEQIHDLYEYWIPVPKIRERFIPDPVSGSNMDYQIPDGFGGIKFTDEFRNLVGAPYVLIPKLDLKINYLGTDGYSTNAIKYQNDIFRTIPRSPNEIFNTIRLSQIDVTNMLNGAAGQGKDMNSLHIPGDPDLFGEPRCGTQMVMPPGTLWIPDRPGYQVTQNTTPLGLRFNFDAGIDGDSIDEATARTHCLNKDLKEPELGVRYFPYMNNDEILVSLAEMTNKSNFRGPWDQVRTWIYTDKVSFEGANEKIFPPVSEGQYAEGLFNVFKLGGLTPADLKNKKFFDPRLLGSATLVDQAFGWLSMKAGEVAGKEVRKWIEGMPENIAKMLKSPENDFEKKHVPRLIKSLLLSLNPDARKGALNFLDKHKDADLLKGKVGDFRASLFSDDAEEAALAKKVAPRFLNDAPPDLRWQMTH